VKATIKRSCNKFVWLSRRYIRFTLKKSCMHACELMIFYY